MTRALIFGTGGVGCVYAYILHKAAGVTVTTVCRTNYNAVKENGILIRSKIFGTQRFRPKAVQSVHEARRHGPFDYVVVCSKAFPGTAETIEPANGIGVEDGYAELYPTNTLISGVVYLPVTQCEPGVVEHGPLERFEIGTFPAASCAKPEAQEQTRMFSAMFYAGGASCPVFDDVQPRKWIKVAVNAAWNPVTALTLCDDANYLRSSPRAETLIRNIMHEVGLIAAAAGYPNVITDEVINDDLQRPLSRLETGGKEPSMLTDVRHGRAMEVEAILGNALRIGEEHGVKTPCLEVIYTLAKARNYAQAPDEHWKPIARHD
ncbi:hypothetical protein BAUCODRAFT_575211 [Baudoinia panamericana UAMH 10762]|uniref:2-dehydropantoate 2-reductase n=1 Tax=Baudoinia panamericana (strain UAMH 10762) TaxID=717646 RepID=M2LS78_BAUPA|nr:uncharacterized protein BAUCODRAFT_575211 [Baudoinia panamericana UAMH 10762]EMC97327.1 hypothetical protein BAUCODRAFT_575211 [Baudoinia panamericana UAMH 10762]